MGWKGKLSPGEELFKILYLQIHNAVPQPLAVLSGHKTSINHVSLSKNEQWLFSASKDSLSLWQLNSCLDTELGMYYHTYKNILHHLYCIDNSDNQNSGSIS